MVAPAAAPESSAERQPSKSLGRRVVKAIAALVVLVVGLFAFAVFYNNVSLRHPTQAEFSAQLDRAIDSSTDWIVKHPDIQGNPPLMFMIGDMAQMSADPRLQQFTQSYLNSRYARVPGRPLTWYYAHWVDASVPLPVVPQGAIGYMGWQDRWFTYATAPDRVPLADEDRANMFSPSKYSWGTRLHLQLIALDIYRHYNGATPELNAAINPVTEGVANDAFWDFRVSDSYEQRSAFMLAAGRPDLVKPRWIERILANQQADGAWDYCWYGWCRGVLEFRSGTGDQGHSTVQAAWALYQLKYKYSDWIKQHYH